MPAIGFRPLLADDLTVLHAWLGRPHVERWWGARGTLEETVAHYGPAIDGTDPTDVYVVLVDGRDAGMIQTYRVSSYPEYAALIGLGVGVAGVDVFLAEEDLVGRGIGTDVIDRFTSEVVLAEPEIAACVADPDAENVASLRAFAKAGFAPVRTFVDPEDGRVHVLVRRERRQAR